MSVYTIDYGHCLKGNVGARGNGLLEEVLTRDIGRLVTQKLRNEGHTVHEIYLDESYNVIDELNWRVNKINSIKPDLSVSIHINSFSDPSANGVEVWVDTLTGTIGQRICTNISSVFKMTNRGTKYGGDSLALVSLYGSSVPAMLVECFFITNATEASNYNAERYAECIVAGVLNRAVKPIYQPRKGYLNVKPFMKQWSIFKDDKSFETWNRLTLLTCSNGLSFKILENKSYAVYKVECLDGIGYAYAEDNNNTFVTDTPAYEVSEPYVKGYYDFRWNATANGTQFAKGVTSDQLVASVKHQLQYGYYNIQIFRADL